jgi:small-conductance mechanosensitive channel
VNVLSEILNTVGIIAAGAACGIVVFLAARLLSSRFVSKTWNEATRQLWSRSASGFGLLLPLLGAYMSLPYAVENVALEQARVVIVVLLIAVTAFLLVRVVRGIEDVVVSRLDLGGTDNLDARRIQTQLHVMRAVLTSFVAFTAVVTILLLVPGFRQLGAGLLASAGIAGLVLGFAAQRALGNLLAGFQIAITQPIRLDDVVVLESEWGRIEEISLTYVVVRIWDERRLILPISYFLEHPFTNWTRESSEILGTVYLYTDYKVPIPALRAELERIVAESKFWDGRVCNLVVTDSTPNALELRALVSAKDGGRAWNLRCEVREKLVEFLAQNYPETLPRIRAEVDSEARAA